METSSISCRDLRKSVMLSKHPLSSEGLGNLSYPMWLTETLVWPHWARPPSARVESLSKKKAVWTKGAFKQYHYNKQQYHFIWFKSIDFTASTSAHHCNLRHCRRPIVVTVIGVPYIYGILAMCQTLFSVLALISFGQPFSNSLKWGATPVS